VQRGQVRELTERLFHDGVDDHRGRELRASVHDAMADGVDLICDAGDGPPDWLRIKPPLVGLILSE
jgi:hypothetical protein